MPLFDDWRTRFREASYHHATLRLTWVAPQDRLAVTFGPTTTAGKLAREFYWHSTVTKHEIPFLVAMDFPPGLRPQARFVTGGDGSLLVGAGESIALLESLADSAPEEFMLPSPGGQTLGRLVKSLLDAAGLLPQAPTAPAIPARQRLLATFVSPRSGPSIQVIDANERWLLDSRQLRDFGVELPSSPDAWHEKAEWLRGQIGTVGSGVVFLDVPFYEIRDVFGAAAEVLESAVQSPKTPASPPEDAYLGIAVEHMNMTAHRNGQSAPFGNRAMPWKLFLKLLDCRERGATRPDIEKHLWPESKAVTPNAADKHLAAVRDTIEPLHLYVESGGTFRLTEF